MYKKVSITFRVLGISLIEVDQMGIECKSGESKEQRLVWSQSMTEYGI